MPDIYSFSIFKIIFNWFAEMSGCDNDKARKGVLWDMEAVKKGI
jgi:hypothetical protein